MKILKINLALLPKSNPEYVKRECGGFSIENPTGGV